MFSEKLSELGHSIKIVTFKKLNGEIRVMKCTTDMGKVPTEYHPKTERNFPNQKNVWDIENEGWRSFKITSITSIEDF